MCFCGEWTDLGETDHETAYMGLVLRGRREHAKGEAVNTNVQGSTSTLRNLAQAMNRSLSQSVRLVA